MKKIILANEILFLDVFWTPDINKTLDLYEIEDLFTKKIFNCYYFGNLELDRFQNRIFQIEKLDKVYEYISPYDSIHIVEYKIDKIFSIDEQKEYIKKHPELLI
jgi:hypothetical protein